MTIGPPAGRSPYLTVTTGQGASRISCWATDPRNSFIMGERRRTEMAISMAFVDSASSSN